MKKASLNHKINRREFLGGLAFSSAAAVLPSFNSIKATPFPNQKDIPLCIFSKHLQWLDYFEMAQATADLGFDGVALTVRPGGHVKPDRVEIDLPKAVDAVRKSGIEVYMLTTNITDPSDPNTEKILKTAAELGIRYYRLGYMRYDQNNDILTQLEKFRPKMKELAQMNELYKIFGGNHNHTENYVGGSIWDTWELFRGLNPEWIGFQFDTGNAIREGAEGTWKTNARLAASRTKMLAVKTDAEWQNPDWQNGDLNRSDNLPMMTPDDFKWFFKMVHEQGISGPLSVHYEFPGLGGADTGTKKLKGINKEILFNIIRRNLNTLKEMIDKAK
jgi:sugar phosphate isomerase/epimerase